MDPDRIRAYDDAAVPDETATATFALGCFWGPDATFGATDGVVRTRVGYAGGTTPKPTYHDIGDHSEVVQVEYDPEVASFADLVDLSFEEQNLLRQPRKRQYHRVVFYESSNEREVIEERISALAVPSGEVETRVEELTSFTLAETYHQKYNLRGKRAVLQSFADMGYDEAAIRESPAAAILTAQVAGKRVPESAPVL